MSNLNDARASGGCFAADATDASSTRVISHGWQNPSLMRARLTGFLGQHLPWCHDGVSPQYQHVANGICGDGLSQYSQVRQLCCFEFAIGGERKVDKIFTTTVIKYVPTPPKMCNEFHPTMQTLAADTTHSKHRKMPRSNATSATDVTRGFVPPGSCHLCRDQNPSPWPWSISAKHLHRCLDSFDGT